MADRFYTPDALSPGEFVLSGAEAHHLAVVRRLSTGSRVVLFNGDGNDYPAEVVATGKKDVVLNVLPSESVDRELPFPLIVAAALPKGDRAASLIEKLTELGVTGFVPLLTERSVVRPTDAVVEKFTRAVIEASKQCGRNRLMAVERPQTWGTFVRRTDLPANRVLLHTVRAEPLRAALTGAVIAVGPEGGFSSDEVTSGEQAAWSVATLGSRILRIETAALAAASLLAAGA